LTKPLKLRPQFRELKNPSAQNSQTVKNLAAATHWSTPRTQSPKENARREPNIGLAKIMQWQTTKRQWKIIFSGDVLSTRNA